MFVKNAKNLARRESPEQGEREPVFTVKGKQYVVATFPASAAGVVVYVAPIGAIGGVNSRPAKAGDIVTLYGIGFGPVSPATGAGTIATRFVGLYQFNVQVPDVSAGDWPLVVQVGGTTVAPERSYYDAIAKLRLILALLS